MKLNCIQTSVSTLQPNRFGYSAMYVAQRRDSIVVFDEQTPIPSNLFNQQIVLKLDIYNKHLYTLKI